MYIEKYLVSDNSFNQSNSVEVFNSSRIAQEQAQNIILAYLYYEMMETQDSISIEWLRQEQEKIIVENFGQSIVYRLRNYEVKITLVHQKPQITISPKERQLQKIRKDLVRWSFY